MPAIERHGDHALVAMQPGSPFVVNTFVAVDVRDRIAPMERLVGTVTEVGESVVRIQSASNPAMIYWVEYEDIEARWWAPMGYRP